MHILTYDSCMVTKIFTIVVLGWCVKERVFTMCYVVVPCQIITDQNSEILHFSLELSSDHWNPIATCCLLSSSLVSWSLVGSYWHWISSDLHSYILPLSISSFIHSSFISSFALTSSDSHHKHNLISLFDYLVTNLDSFSHYFR